MGVNSKDLNENGYALCACCRKKYFISELEDKCAFCNKWYCKSCSRPTPEGHGSGNVCKICYMKYKK